MNIKDLYRIFMRYEFDKQLQQQDGVRITVLFDIILFNTYIILYKIDDREKSIKAIFEGINYDNFVSKSRKQQR